jgi:Raf kinase inhibitor-like YbhB/YbcL family protein
VPSAAILVRAALYGAINPLYENDRRNFPSMRIVTMRLFSSAFRDGELIPPKYTCDGENVSPPLEWEGVPENAKSLALIMDDPDAPSGLFVHWLLFNIPSSENGLTEGVGIAGPAAGGGTQGKNGFNQTAYGGPCPPGGTHRYYFHLYALDAGIGLSPGAGRPEVETAIRSHIITEAQLMGRYARQ